MNLLASSYVDAHYKQYLETNPLLAVCVIGTGSHVFEQYLLQSEGPEYRMCVTALDSIEQLTTKSGKVHADSRSNIFKSDWCLKHQSTIHSCIVLCFNWNAFGQGNVPAADLHVFEVAKQRLRFSNCKVVVACTSEGCTIDVNEPTFNAVRNEMKAILGPSFVDLVVVGQDSAAIRTSAELRVVVVETSLNYHQSEIRRLRDQKKADEQSESSVMIRTHFKMGWHCLCVRDHANAMKQFSKAYKVSKSLFPVHPTFEVRLCSSIVLFHLVSVILSSGDPMQMNELLLSDVISHIDWINQPFASEYSENCRNLSITLLSYLAAEWFEVLARKFVYIDTASRQDYFFAAAHCLIDVVEVVPREYREELEIPAPPFVGTECSVDAYANLALARVCKKSVGEKINKLLEEAAGLGDLSVRRNAEKLYYQFICGDGSLLQPEKVLFCGLSSFIFNNCCSMLLEKNNYDKRGAQTDIYCLVHRCVDPTTPLAQLLYREKLKDYLKQLGDSTAVLKYPYLGFSAFFTVVPFFHQTSVESGHFSLFTLSLFTSSLIPITVEELKVTCATRNSEKIVEVECPGVYNLSASARVDVRAGSIFRYCGEYLCQLVEAKVVVDSFSFAICWSLTPDSWDSLLSVGANVLLCVRNPISLASIECPTVIEAVEGESVVIDIVIKNNKENALQNCTLSFLSLPKLFSAKLFSDNGEECCAAPLKRNGFTSFSIEDVSAGGSIVSAYNGSCLKSGLFRMLVLFNFSTNEYPDMEIRKTIDVSVDPPFMVSSTFIRSANWLSEGGHFLISRTDPAYEINDSYVLGKADGITEPSEYYELQKNETYLYYAVKESQEPVQVFTLSVGETLAFYVRVTYVGRNGITVHGADFIAFDELDIIHVSDGDMPCLLSESESVSVVVHSTLKEEVNFSPGFVRVRFSPQRMPDSMLVADLFLPEVTVERIPITVTYCYPSSVLVSLPFSLEISICNTGTTSLAGRVSVDSSSLNFCYSGRVNWEVNLGPEESTKTAIQLIPLASGDIKLPAVFVERTGHSPFKCGNSLFVIVEPNVDYDCR